MVGMRPNARIDYRPQGTRIAKARNEAGLSTQQLSYMVNNRVPKPLQLSEETLRKYEHGKVPQLGPSPVIIGAIAAILKMPLKGLDVPPAWPDDKTVEEQLAQICAIYESIKGSRKPRRLTRGSTSSEHSSAHPLGLLERAS